MTDAETIAAIVGTLLGLGALLRGAWRFNRRVVQIASAVTELSSNGGHSMKDTVQRNAETATRTEAKVDHVAEQLAQHLRDHERRPRWRLVRRG